MEKNSVLTLSTAHMPNSTPDFGNSLSVMKYDSGYVVLCHDDPNAPEWLKHILNAAAKEGCSIMMRWGMLLLLLNSKPTTGKNIFILALL